MKKFALILIALFSLMSVGVLAQQKRANRDDIDKQMEEIMKAREEMFRSLLNDSAFGDMDNFDSHFDDLIKKFQQAGAGGLGMDMDMGAVVGEYDWKETDKDKILVLKVKQIKNRPLDIKIEKGQIKLKGDVESVSNDPDKKKKQVSKVHFERIFSIPDGVDQTNPQFENKGDELQIKFRKIAVKPSPTEREPVAPEATDVTI